jgi:hypothetical protein
MLEFGGSLCERGSCRVSDGPLVIEDVGPRVGGCCIVALPCGACSPALGKPLGRHQNLRHVAFIVEFMEFIAAGDRAMRQFVCIVLELAPYRRRRCLMFGGKGVVSTALLMLAMTSSVYLRWGLRQRDAVSAVPMYPPGSGSVLRKYRDGKPSYADVN